MQSSISFFFPACQSDRYGHSYNGSVAVTAAGWPCLPWKSVRKVVILYPTWVLASSIFEMMVHQKRYKNKCYCKVIALIFFNLTEKYSSVIWLNSFFQSNIIATKLFPTWMLRTSYHKTYLEREINVEMTCIGFSLPQTRSVQFGILKTISRLSICALYHSARQDVSSNWVTSSDFQFIERI